MSLQLRHQRLFRDVVDLYEPEALTLDAPTGLDERGYPATPTYAGVKCHIEPKPEGSVPLEMGRSGTDNIDTTDRIHVALDQEIGDGWAIQLKTDGHPERLTWWIAQGDPRTQNWRAKKRVVFVKRGLKPPGVA
jgi:hypothetical protein